MKKPLNLFIVTPYMKLSFVIVLSYIQYTYAHLNIMGVSSFIKKIHNHFGLFLERIKLETILKTKKTHCWSLVGMISSSFTIELIIPTRVKSKNFCIDCPYFFSGIRYGPPKRSQR